MGKNPHNPNIHLNGIVAVQDRRKNRNAVAGKSKWKSSGFRKLCGRILRPQKKKFLLR